MNGRSVLYVPGVAEQKRLFIQTASANEMKAQVLDCLLYTSRCV